MSFVGEVKVVEITLPGPATVLNCYRTGPDGANSEHLEFNYPCAEITRTDSTHYTFTTPKHLRKGSYRIEILATIDAVDRVTKMPPYRIDPVVSPDLATDVGALP